MAKKQVNSAQKTTARGATTPENQAGEEKSTKPKQFRKAAQEEIGKTYKKIVQTLATEAIGGSVPHTKLLFDLGGVKDEVRAAGSSKRRRPPSLGKILLE